MEIYYQRVFFVLEGIFATCCHMGNENWYESLSNITEFKLLLNIVLKLGKRKYLSMEKKLDTFCLWYVFQFFGKYYAIPLCCNIVRILQERYAFARTFENYIQLIAYQKSKILRLYFAFH